MLVHLALVLALALLGVGLEKREAVRDLFVSKLDESDKLEEPEGDPQQNEPLETDVTVEAPVMQALDAAADFNVDAAFEVPNNNDDKELAAALTALDPNALSSVMSGDVASDISGSAASGNFGGRTAAGRRAGAVRKGGNGASEAAVEAALKWIAAHQTSNGGWHYDHRPGGNCNCGNPGSSNGTFGATGLALLPFLSAGYTHKEGKYKKVVEGGLNHLVGNMKVDPANGTGKMFDGGHAAMYAHGLASIALTEAYGMTRDPKLKAPAQAALNWIILSQHKDQHFWGYTGGGGDTSVSGWQIMALKSGYLAYLDVPKTTIDRISLGLDRVQTESGAYYGYNGPGKGPATTAIGLLSRMYLGAKHNNPALAQGMNFLAQSGPNLQNMYYTYYANQAMFQYTNGEGPQWHRWNMVMRDSLVQSQARQGHESGSWNHGRFVSHGGRLYSTSLCCMCLQVYYRYVGIYQRGAGHAAPGAGIVGGRAAVAPPKGADEGAPAEDNFPTE